MGATDNLRHAADAVSAKAKEVGGAGFEVPMRRLYQAAQRVGLAWCGSWLPGMANLYGQALQPAAGGLPRQQELAGSGRIGWVEWAPDDIRRSIHVAAGEPDAQQLKSTAARAAISFGGAKASCLPLLAATVAAHGGDAVLGALEREARRLELVDHDTLLDSWRPEGKVLRRGSPADADSSHDWEAPAHLSELAAIEALRSPLIALQTLAGLLRRAAEHCKGLAQKAMQGQQPARLQTLALPGPAQLATPAVDTVERAPLATQSVLPAAPPSGSSVANPIAVTGGAHPTQAVTASVAKPGRSPAFPLGAQAPLHQFVADNAVWPRPSRSQAARAQ